MNCLKLLVFVFQNVVWNCWFTVSANAILFLQFFTCFLQVYWLEQVFSALVDFVSAVFDLFSAVLGLFFTVWNLVFASQLLCVMSH